MGCRSWIPELVEVARTGARPGEELGGHLAACARCAARWKAERELSSKLRLIREAVPEGRDFAARDRLMAQFAFRRRQALARKRFIWVLAAAAVLLIALFVPKLWRSEMQRGFAPGSVEMAEIEFGETAGNGGFVTIPYAPPLAQGEFIRVVRTELPRAALVRMGFAVEAAYEGGVIADVVEGQDGLPRAVRLPQSLDMSY